MHGGESFRKELPSRRSSEAESKPLKVFASQVL